MSLIHTFPHETYTDLTSTLRKILIVSFCRTRFSDFHIRFLQGANGLHWFKIAMLFAYFLLFVLQDEIFSLSLITTDFAQSRPQHWTLWDSTLNVFEPWAYHVAVQMPPYRLKSWELGTGQNKNEPINQYMIDWLILCQMLHKML